MLHKIRRAMENRDTQYAYKALVKQGYKHQAKEFHSKENIALTGENLREKCLIV